MKRIDKIVTRRKEQNLRYIRNKEELGNTLRYIRQCEDVTQAEIAEAIHVDRSTYAYYELGKTLPSIFILIGIAKYYKIDIRYLLTKRPK